MCYWNEEDYFEPGEFDEEIEDLKEKLRNSVKQETKDTIEKLRKENQELQSIKKNFEAIKSDFEKKKHEYEIAMRDAEYKAKQARLSELMENNKVIVYGVESEYLYKKKCDKCDISRNIQITLPSGRVVDDRCKCNVTMEVYKPKQYELYELSQRVGKREVHAWYKKKTGTVSDYYFEREATHADMMVDHNVNFEDIGDERRGIFFTSAEECQEFCDYLNKDTEIDEFAYNRAGCLLSEIPANCEMGGVKYAKSCNRNSK